MPRTNHVTSMHCTLELGRDAEAAHPETGDDWFVTASFGSPREACAYLHQWGPMSIGAAHTLYNRLVGKFAAASQAVGKALDAVANEKQTTVALQRDIVVNGKDVPRGTYVEVIGTAGPGEFTIQAPGLPMVVVPQSWVEGEAS